MLIGFVVFLAFESFDTSRSGAEAEARTVVQQFETAQFLPIAVRAQLSGDLVCYARAVIYQEWPRMESGTLGNLRNPWSLAMLRTLRTTEPRSASEQTAYAKWFDQRSDREDGRADRIHGAEGVIPLPVWIVLLIASGVIFVYMLFFADSAERAIVQATMMGGVAVVITSTLLLLVFLDHPYESGVGGLRPVAMERALGLIGRRMPLRERGSSSRATRRGPRGSLSRPARSWPKASRRQQISEPSPSVESRGAGPGIGYFPDVFGSLFNPA